VAHLIGGESRSASQSLSTRTKFEDQQYNSIGTFSDEDMKLVKVYTTELLSTIDHFSVPTHAMVLKVGMTFMLLRDLAAQNGDCNRSR